VLVLRTPLVLDEEGCRQSEVDQIELVEVVMRLVMADQDVVWLQVVVHEPDRVHLLQEAHDLHADHLHGLEREGTLTVLLVVLEGLAQTLLNMEGLPLEVPDAQAFGERRVSFFI